MSPLNHYPEHAKLHEVKDDSQAIGTFLDVGLAAQGLAIYESVEEECDCEDCVLGETVEAVGVHAEADRVENGAAIYRRWRPTSKSISSILAAHFGIDQEKLAAEKDQMLAAIRGDEDQEPVAERATIVHKDGRRVKLERRKGSKAFTVLDPKGKTTALSYSRRKLKGRPGIDRTIDRIEFERNEKK